MVATTKLLVHYRPFFQIILFKTAIFWSTVQKESVVKPANSTVSGLTV